MCFLSIGSDSPADVTVNDTVSGDPVMTVPILVPRDQLEMVQSDRLSLCYEVHGRPDTWFNLVSDECASVNAHYSAITDELNVIDKIAIQAVDWNGLCRNITVDSKKNCQVSIDGTELKTFTDGGIRIQSRSKRVRVSVPNCNTVALAMWVECVEQDHLASGSSGTEGDDLLLNEGVKFVVMRGLNHGHQFAHGLVGKQLPECAACGFQ